MKNAVTESRSQIRLRYFTKTLSRSQSLDPFCKNTTWLRVWSRGGGFRIYIRIVQNFLRNTHNVAFCNIVIAIRRELLQEVI